MYERLRKGEMLVPAVFVDDTEVSQGYIDYFTINRALAKSRKTAEA